MYSMDADMAPVHEMLELTKELFPHGNAVFSIDEAHSNGLVGEHGSGYICYYGLEKKFPIRLHTCGKGLGSNGAAVLANSAIRSYLINYAKSLIFSTAPAFPSLAAVKEGTPIIPLVTEPGQAASLAQRLQSGEYQVNPVFYPIVPSSKERVRLVMHADNTAAQIDEAVDLIMDWSRSRLMAQVGESDRLVSSEDLYQNTAFSD
ncbi:uncharacterized protein N7477_005437 [Penicillium maclennaniae]|uniref:uncharacterized protein n=1 Tax=Penicillium maclennaniae TaxID=1343394 RepID=UPI00253FB894|nr:uncharacterized protein N7477_005437 [Penicillium maclennaniae]KAJ5670074.1 hypothetical protein N7477_005437 [Penicillium maclennaniae]